MKRQGRENPTSAQLERQQHYPTHEKKTQIQSFYNWCCLKDILDFLFILTSSPRGINVTFTSFSVSTKSGSFTAFFLGWLWILSVQHTATETIDLCSCTTVNDSPLGKLAGEVCPTRGIHTGKISENKCDYGRGFKNHPLGEFWERTMKTKNADCFSSDKIQKKETNNNSVNIQPVSQVSSTRMRNLYFSKAIVTTIKHEASKIAWISSKNREC